MPFLDSVEEAASVIGQRSLLRKVHGTAMVVGDIHGDIDALQTVIRKRDEIDTKYLILLGDYVDRGHQQLEVVESICELLLSDPYFVALRGNHEDALVCSRYGFSKVVDQAGMSIEPFLTLFSHLPIAAVSNEVFMAHGGIPVSNEFKVDQIGSNPEQFPRDVVLKSGLQSQICWNDPIYDGSENDVEQRTSVRGSSIYEFGQQVTDRFLERNDLSLILRAHIALTSGSMWMHQNKILSLFTSQGGVYKDHKRHIATLNLDEPSTTEVIDISR